MDSYGIWPTLKYFTNLDFPEVEEFPDYTGMSMVFSNWIITPI